MLDQDLVRGQMPPTEIDMTSVVPLSEKDRLSALPYEIQIQVYDLLNLLNAIPLSLTSKLWFWIHRVNAQGIKFRKVALNHWDILWDFCYKCPGPCALRLHLKDWFPINMEKCYGCDKYFETGTHDMSWPGCGMRDYGTGFIVAAE